MHRCQVYVWTLAGTIFVAPYLKATTISGSATFVASAGSTLYQSGSTFENQYFLDVFGSLMPSTFSGPLRVPVNVNYSIDLASGAGFISDSTADGEFVQTIGGGPGAFSASGDEIQATSSALVSITDLEHPTGTPVSGSDPAWSYVVSQDKLIFDGSLGNSFITQIDQPAPPPQPVVHTTIIIDHDNKTVVVIQEIVSGPEPASIALAGTGLLIIGLAGRKLRHRKKLPT